MAAAENFRCNLSVEEEIHDEWMLNSISDMGYYFEFDFGWNGRNIYSTISKNRVCIPLKTTQPDTDIAYKRYYWRNRKKKRGKKYMNFTYADIILLSKWFALSVYDSWDWLSAKTTLLMGQILGSLSPLIGVFLCVGHYFVMSNFSHHIPCRT